MKIRNTLLLLFFFSQPVLAQSTLPLIRATSKQVHVREEKDLKINAWNISPEIRPDIYTTDIKNCHITFYTNLDSISFLVVPGKTYNFIILLNNKDTAYTQIKYQASYLDILKGAEKYNASDHRVIPAFTYQDSANPNLVALRKGFKLDSIAGAGTEVSKIIQLMHWIHTLIPHDGTHENPAVKNAMSLITACKKTARGLNCRGLATVLNECYLSLGIKSRIITCMPRDSVFNDCHVINMVYSKEKNKWLWIDPTNDAYVMDETGNLLSIAEVRERIIKGNTLILNPDANWNHSASVQKEAYLYEYMAKNLYRLECPLVSEFDYETRKEGKQLQYVELLPLDALNQTPKKQEAHTNHTGTTFIDYKTNNPEVFWTQPK